MATTWWQFRGPDPRLVLAVAAMLFGIWPGMVPHAAWLTAVVGGLLAAQAWAIAAGARWVWHRLRRTAGRRTDRPSRAGGLGWVVLAVASVVALMAAWVADLRLADRVGTAPPRLLDHLAGAAGAALLAALLVGTPRAIRAAGRILAPRAAAGSQPPAPSLRSLQVGTAGLALVVVVAGVVAPSASATAATATVGVSSDQATWRGTTSEGRRFVSRLPVLERPPLRVYASLDTGAQVQDRVRRAVDALEAAGGLDRSVVLVAVPTGSGWVNRAAPSALERLLDGNVATLAVQYADSPSWLAFLRGGEGAEVSVDAVLAAVTERVRARPPALRPRVLVWGESLGAWAGLTAAAGSRSADGLLWAGVPAAAPRPDQAVAARTVLLTHTDDPVATWRLRLAVSPDDRLRPWLPVATFWRATADVVSALDVPPGHGHRYGEEYTAAWQQLLRRVRLDSRSRPVPDGTCATRGNACDRGAS